MWEKEVERVRKQRYLTCDVTVKVWRLKPGNRLTIGKLIEFLEHL